MAKKIGKGKEITELVKGSVEYTIEWIHSQFRAQFPYVEAGPNYWIADSFADYVVVGSYSPNSGLMPNEYFKVTYTRDGDNYSFAPRDQWEVVELGYQPRTMLTESKKKKGKRFEETLDATHVQFLEAKDASKATRRIRIENFMVANEINGNKRLYPPQVIEAMVNDWQPYLRESRGQGRLTILTGEMEHPSDKGKKRPEYLETVVRWDTLDWDGKRVNIEGDLILTAKGRDVEILMDAGVNPGASFRGVGEARIEKVNGEKIEIVEWVSMNAADLVGDPSFINVAEFVESKNKPIEGDEEMNLEELLKLLKEHPEAFAGITEAQIKKMGEDQLKALEDKVRAALGIDANANITESLKTMRVKAEKFEAAEAQKAVEAAITENTKDLPYGKDGNAAFVESVREANLSTKEAVVSFVESQKKTFDKIYSKKGLESKGFNFKGNIQPLGDVIENETGTPEFARASFELQESLRKREMRPVSDLSKREDRAAVFTLQLLEKFDKMYQRQLLEEAKLFQEAELTTDLNLPYSVSRTVLAEAFPNLVSANVFDVGLIDQTPTRLYYEAFAGETGYTVAVVDEVETGGAEGVWYDLDNKNITPGTMVVTSNPAGTTYVEGTDYIVDYELGKIWFLAAGSIGANDILASYSYNAIRKGENVAIERSKTTLSYQTIEAAADRLATYISDEAIKFSRSQIGWDAVGRTMSNLIREIRRDIDRRLIEKGVMAALSVASNSGGTWDISDSDEADLVAKLGAAMVKVANRFYDPTFILCSITNAERLSNWTGFQRDGFPNALLQASGFQNMIVKGLPVFASPLMRDTWFLVGNREVVMHRVYSPMTVKGPYPVFDSGKVIAAEQYYAEEYNAAIAPIGGKASYVLTQA